MPQVTVACNSNREYTASMIVSVQDRFISWIKRKFHFPSSTNNVFVSFVLEITSLHDKRTYFDLVPFYGHLHGIFPQETSIAIRRPCFSLRNRGLFLYNYRSDLSPNERCKDITNSYNNRIDFFQYSEKKFQGKVKKLLYQKDT